MRKYCPFQGCWDGKGENPCPFAKWKKKKYPVYKYQGAPMTNKREVAILLDVINNWGIVYLIGFYRKHTADLEWEAQKELINKEKYHLYDEYYRYWELKEVTLETVDGGFGFETLKLLRFLPHEYGLYHIFEFLHSIVPKGKWKVIKEVIEKDEYPVCLEQYKEMHICGSCSHEYIQEPPPNRFAECPKCGWGGY